MININIVQFIINMKNPEKTSSMPSLCETNGQDQNTPEHVTVASVSLSGMLKDKNCSQNSKNIH